MKRVVVLSLVLLAACEDWGAQLEAIRAIADKKEALEKIARLDAELAKRDDVDALARRADLILFCKLSRVTLMEKAAASNEAIALLEKVLEKEPGRVRARYLLARTCLALPAFFGKRDKGIAALEELVATAERRPGSVPYPDVFLRLAKLKPAEQDRILRVGRRSFPDRKDMVAEPPPDATGAKRGFVEALEKNELDYEALDKPLAAGQAQFPKDPDYPLLRGLLRLWRLERTQDGHAASEAIELFRLARKLNPNDTRIDGWLGPLLFLSGTAIQKPAMVDEGRRIMDRGAEANPEQNRFGRALAYRRTGQRSDLVAEDLYKTIEVCSGKTMDRTRFLPPPSTSAHPSCRDSKKAPHNVPGTFFWAGEFFRTTGQKKKAADAFAAALAADGQRTWPYRALADERLAFLKGDRKQLTPAPTSCALCHAKE